MSDAMRFFPWPTRPRAKVPLPPGVVDPAFPPPIEAWFTGLDLGRTQDFSALASILQTTTEDAEGRRIRTYRVHKLHRWELNTPYDHVMLDVKELFELPHLKGTHLVIDGTGVGRPIVDLFRTHAYRPDAKLTPIYITGGYVTNQAQGGGYTVPKSDIAMTAVALSDCRRLTVVSDAGQPFLEEVIQELRTFTSKTNPATLHESFESWRSRDKDDIVLAVSIALWHAEKGQKRLVIG